MNINSLLNKTIDFTTKRVAELIGLLLVFLSILLLISLISYSPEDPNFIFPENTEIKLPRCPKKFFISVFSGKIKLGSSGE